MLKEPTRRKTKTKIFASLYGLKGGVPGKKCVKTHTGRKKTSDPMFSLSLPLVFTQLLSLVLTVRNTQMTNKTSVDFFLLNKYNFFSLTVRKKKILQIEDLFPWF